MRQERKRPQRRVQGVWGGVRVVIVDGLGREHLGTATPEALKEYCSQRVGPGGCFPKTVYNAVTFRCHQPNGDCAIPVSHGGKGPAKIDFRNHLGAVTDPRVSFDQEQAPSRKRASGKRTSQTASRREGGGIEKPPDLWEDQISNGKRRKPFYSPN